MYAETCLIGERRLLSSVKLCKVLSDGFLQSAIADDAWHFWCNGGTLSARRRGHRTRGKFIRAVLFCLFSRYLVLPFDTKCALMKCKEHTVINSMSVGATGYTSNTAELAAMVELCWFSFTAP